MRNRPLPTLCLIGGLCLLPPSTAAARETTPELVAVLESDASLEAKAIACRQLGELGTPEAVPALASLLDHEVLGAYARSGLERIPGPEGAAALRAALETTEGERRIGVITSLGALRDEQAVAALSALAGDDDAATARAALLALGRVASPEAVQVVTVALSSGRDGAAAACMLAAEQQRAQGATAGAIALFDAVRSADVPEPYRLGATRGAIVTRNSVPFLMEQLGSDQAAMRDVALLAIREMPSDSLADALHARLATSPPELRVQLITALRDCHNAASFGVVRAELDSDTPAVRRAALGVVSAVGHGPELATTLLDVVQANRSAGERQTAIELLSRMEGGTDVDQVLLARLQAAEGVSFRKDVIRVLGNRRSATAVDALLEQARDDDRGVRVAALRAMRRVVGPQQVPALIALIQAEPDDGVRTAAITPLISACGDDAPSGERVLAELRRASDASERDIWTRVLTAVGYPEALPVVLAALEDADPETVTRTITRLSEWPDPAPIEPLLALMAAERSPEVQARACTAVIQLATGAAAQHQRPDDVVVGWFRRANPAVHSIEEKRLLVSGLARVRTLESFRLLEPYLRDPEVRDEALYALLAIAPPLVKAGHQDAVRKALPSLPSIEDDDLRWRLTKLEEEVAEAEGAG